MAEPPSTPPNTPEAPGPPSDPGSTAPPSDPSGPGSAVPPAETSDAGSMGPPSLRAPVIEPGHTMGTVTDSIAAIVLTKKPNKIWLIGFAVSFALLMVFFWSIGNLVLRGIGLWGVNQPVGWGFDIVNFVWWIGIGHAGTLISAVLLLLRQDWRTSINRFAEAMTLFAVACAGMYPVFHLGRPWLMYWLFPYPNTMQMWPNFRSPLLFDVFAVSTYFTVSALFWFVGLVPDMATLRDRATTKAARLIYGALSLGWRGSARHWHHYETAYLLLAGLSAPLVVSVHTIVSFDFANSVVPGWHATVFPPYFVAGAIYAGFAMVITLAVPLRAVFKLGDFITQRHMDNMGKVMLATGLIVAYGYGIEIFNAWYSGSVYEWALLMNRMTGPYAWSFWGLMICNVIAPQFLWSTRIRANMPALMTIAMFVNVGMWLERFVIVVTSLHRDYLPSSWGMYTPTIWDISTFIGTIGLFFTLLFLFIRFLPSISIFEVRTLLPQAKPEDDDDDDDEPAPAAARAGEGAR
jgi:molybdopterin-containing oxidoreductase family membrane subunit